MNTGMLDHPRNILRRTIKRLRLMPMPLAEWTACVCIVVAWEHAIDAAERFDYEP